MMCRGRCATCPERTMEISRRREAPDRWENESARKKNSQQTASKLCRLAGGSSRGARICWLFGWLNSIVSPDHGMCGSKFHRICAGRQISGPGAGGVWGEKVKILLCLSQSRGLRQRSFHESAAAATGRAPGCGRMRALLCENRRNFFLTPKCDLLLCPLACRERVERKPDQSRGETPGASRAFSPSEPVGVGA